VARNRDKRKFLPVTILVREEDGQFCSWCPELDIASCGNTVEESCANLKEAVTLFLDTLSEIGEIDQFFQEKGLNVKSQDDVCENNTFVSSWQAPIEVNT
jgi:predicted RNase H-like HicB family nuclease